MLKKLFAALLPDKKPPKVPSREQAIPKYLGTAERGAKISNSSSNITNLSLSPSLRYESTMNETIKKLVLASPDLSSAIVTKINTVITNAYTVVAYDELGRVDKKGTEAAHAFIRSIDLSAYDYTKFTRSTDLRSLCSSLLYDNLRYNSMFFELVLNAARLPSHFKPIPARLVDWAADNPSSYPIYKGATDIPLNYPTIFHSTSYQDHESPYADSFIQSAIQVCLWDMEFLESLRKAAVKNLLTRLSVTIKSEEYIKTLPLEVTSNKDKLKAHMSATVAELESQLNGLEPEDSLVYFDILSVDTIADSNRSEDRSIEVLQSVINGKIASGAKILPSIIGRGSSANAASTESALFIKSLTAVQHELNIMLSRAMTLVVRLFGNASTVVFKFKEINLRPDLELASFKAMEQSIILEQLSYGMISDLEAVIALTGTLPPAGYKDLAGTGFKTTKTVTSGNDYSNTNVGPSDKPDSTQSQKDEEVKNKGVKSK